MGIVATQPVYISAVLYEGQYTCFTIFHAVAVVEQHWMVIEMDAENIQEKYGMIVLVLDMNCSVCDEDARVWNSF